MLAAFLLLAPSVWAQPANDTVADALRVGAPPFMDEDVPFSSAVDDTEDIAPAVGDDDCGGGALDGAWYHFTPLTEGDVTVTVEHPGTHVTILLYTADSEDVATAAELTPLSSCQVRSTLTLDDAVVGQSYYVFVGNRNPFGVGQPSDVTFTGTAGLPVELAAFTATADGEAVVLRWTTASETSNAGFEVQHAAATDAPQWHTLAFVEGRGTTTEAQHYSYRAEGLAPGTYRFRLKQIDLDGTFAYSPEVEAREEMPGAYALSSVYPNPFNPRAHFTLAVQQVQQVRVALFDLLGREVALLHDGILEGGTPHRFEIDGALLPSGAYLVRLTGERFDAVRRVTLVK